MAIPTGKIGLAAALVAAFVAFAHMDAQPAAASSGGGEGGGGGGTMDLDPGVSGVVARARERMEACRSPDLPDSEQIECVSRVLDKVANELRTKPGMRRDQRVFRATASAVRQSSSPSEAVAAVEQGRSELLRSDGTQQAEARELAQVMDAARSVLRS
jgi:hypothetical protein